MPVFFSCDIHKGTILAYIYLCAFLGDKEIRMQSQVLGDAQKRFFNYYYPWVCLVAIEQIVLILPEFKAILLIRDGWLI